MRLNSEGLRELYQRETSRSTRASSTGCPTGDLLVRAAAGELDQSERERTADHLATCSDCAKEYHALRSLKPWTEEAYAKAGARSDAKAAGASLRLWRSAGRLPPRRTGGS